MEIEHRKQEDVLIVNILSDRLDAQGVVDSSGLGAMVSVFKLIGEDGEIVICGPSEAAMRMFKLTRMNRVFRIFEKEEEAVRALSKG
jgi:anti-sigma B factor antagonist